MNHFTLVSMITETFDQNTKNILQLRSHISLLLVIYIVALFETLTFYYRMGLNDFE